jgi:predicted enzyme related to lactoylglutathione lyase
MPHAVTWFEISSNDPSNLAAFYKKAFGWKVDPQTRMIQAEKDGNQQGIAGSFNEAERGTEGVTVYVTCADVDSHLQKVEAAGGTTLMPRFDLPEAMGSIATFRDPAGNKIGLWSPGSATKAPEKASKKAKKAKKADKKEAKQAKKAAKAEKKGAKKAHKAEKKGAKASKTPKKKSKA